MDGSIMYVSLHDAHVALHAVASSGDKFDIVTIHKVLDSLPRFYAQPMNETAIFPCARGVSKPLTPPPAEIAVVSFSVPPGVMQPPPCTEAPIFATNVGETCGPMTFDIASQCSELCEAAPGAASPRWSDIDFDADLQVVSKQPSLPDIADCEARDFAVPVPRKQPCVSELGGNISLAQGLNSSTPEKIDQEPQMQTCDVSEIGQGLGSARLNPGLHLGLNSSTPEKIDQEPKMQTCDDNEIAQGLGSARLNSGFHLGLNSRILEKIDQGPQMQTCDDSEIAQGLGSARLNLGLHLGLNSRTLEKIVQEPQMQNIEHIDKLLEAPQIPKFDNAPENSPRPEPKAVGDASSVSCKTRWRSGKGTTSSVALPQVMETSEHAIPIQAVEAVVRTPQAQTVGNSVPVPKVYDESLPAHLAMFAGFRGIFTGAHRVLDAIVEHQLSPCGFATYVNESDRDGIIEALVFLQKSNLRKQYRPLYVDYLRRAGICTLDPKRLPTDVLKKALIQLICFDEVQ